MDDLLESSYWRPVWRLLQAFDQEIAALYAEAGITGMRTRFVRPLIRLGQRGPLTIRELADVIEVTHSAMSQTIAEMRRAGLVEAAENQDRRTRRVRLTDRARELLPFLEAEWRATEATVRQLDAEVPYPLTRVVADIEAAVTARPFRDRLREHLAEARAGRLR